MLDSNTILGIGAYLECEEYEHGLLTQNTDAWPCGTPVVYPAKGLDLELRDSRRPSIRVYTLMPPCQRAGGVETAQVHVRGIMPVALKPLYNNHKVLTVNEFEIGKFGRLTEFIRDVGAISLIIELDAGRKELAKSIAELRKFFKYTSLFSYNTWPDKFLSGEDDKFVCVLTFLDLPYCIPLFNMRKVDGIGLSFSGATIEMSKGCGHLYRTFRADFIHSNFEDNVFFVDGISVNSMNPPNSDIYKELGKLAGQHLKIGKPDKEKKSDRYGYNAMYKKKPTSLVEPAEMLEGEAPEMAEEEVPGPSMAFINSTLDGTEYHGGGKVGHTVAGGSGQYITTNDEFIWGHGDSPGPDQAVDDEPEEEGG